MDIKNSMPAQLLNVQKVLNTLTPPNAATANDASITNSHILDVLSNTEILLEVLADNEGANDILHDTDRAVRLMKRFGVSNEKEIMNVLAELQKIPCDESSSARYLLDPHLLLALLIQESPPESACRKIEVYEYKKQGQQQKISEAHFYFDLEKLGEIEVLLRFADNVVWTWIWAQKEETHILLHGHESALRELNGPVQIVPSQAGPLFPREIGDDLDVMV